MCLVIGVEVSRYSVVRSRIRPVWCYIYLDDRIVLHMVVLGSGHAYRRIGRQYDDTGMVSSDTNLILRADHSPAVLAAKLTFLDRKALIAIIQHRSYRRYNHLLSGRYVRRTAYYR